MIAPFSIVRPATAELPIVVEVPHAGVHLDPETLGYTIAPAYAVGRDADLYVDRIFEGTPRVGANLLASRISRFVIDKNRAEDDYDSATVIGGPDRPRPRGLVWRTSTDGDPILRRSLPRTELERRLDAFYRPYHAALSGLLSELRARHDHVVLLCAHSMPSTGRRGHVDVGAGRADIVPGTRGRTTARPELISVVEQVCGAHGLGFAHDDPYRGGYATGHYANPAQGISAIQVEIARRLYMDEETLAPEPAGMERLSAFARSLTAALGEAARSLAESA